MSISVMQFDGVTVTPKDDAVLYDLIFNTYGIFNGCSISFLGVNQLMINSGRMIIKGRQVKITEETVSVQLSPSGSKKGRLYIQLDFSKTENPGVFLSQVADTLPALIQEADANYNNGIFEVELCNYDVNETVISNIISSCPTISGVAKVAKTMEEVMAATDPNMAAGVATVKQINNSLVGIINYLSGLSIVPIMTSDITPSGKVIYDSNFDENTKGYHAFDGQGITTCWAAHTNQNTYIGYKPTFAKITKKVSFKNRNYTTYYGVDTYKIQGSNDNSNWVDLTATLTALKNTDNQVISIANTTAYQYYRMFIFRSTNASLYCSLHELQFYGY